MRRSWLLSPVLVAVVVSGCAAEGAWKFVDAAPSRDDPPRGLARYQDHLFGWHALYPKKMHVRDFEHYTGLSTIAGTVFTNFAVNRAIEDDVDPVKQAPPDGVVFVLWQRAGGPAPDLHGEEVRLPLALDDFEAGIEEGIQPPPRFLAFLANGWDLNATAWFGPRASSADRRAIHRLVASIRFPRLEEGTLAAGVFQVLGYADQYPVGSVTKFDEGDLATGHHASRSPFYLIHAPGGFYALGWHHDVDSGFKGCNVEFDRSRFEFFCRENGARWDRRGAVITRPHWARIDDPLSILATKVGQDGHVLVTQSSTTNYFDPKLWPESECGPLQSASCRWER